MDPERHPNEGGARADLGCGALTDPARLEALRRVGLGPGPDAAMDHFAEWVRRALDVPVALVSLVQPDQQVFPGMTGLPEPWADKRATPLSHSFCQHVVLTAQPLVVTDAREHPLVRDNLAVPELGVVAYAGMPLTDTAGNVLGSLCAIDTRRREWTAEQLETLRDIAHACSLDLRLRLSVDDSDREGDRRDQLEDVQQRLLRRNETMLAAAAAFTGTVTTGDVRDRLHDLIVSDLRPAFVATVLRDQRGRLLRLDDFTDPALIQPFEEDAPVPSAVAVREGRAVYYPDRAAFDAAFPASTRAILRDLGLHCLVAVPLPGAGEPMGALVFGWAHPDAIDAADLLTISTIAGYAAQAFARADLLAHRVTVAHALQDAMLATLPRFDGLDLAARYQPADSRENVGGDWYDAVAVADGSGSDLLTVSVGDITGHTLDAATLMGQTRSMLRQVTWDLAGAPPSTILRTFDAANVGTGLGATGTAVVAHLRRRSAGPSAGWTVEWTCAGHPPPILLLPDGTVEVIGRPDPLFGYRSLLAHPRVDHHRDVPPGSVLFLYTDGLIEDRRRTLDEGLDALVARLRRLHDRPAQEIVDTVTTELATDATDDVVTFAIRFRTG